jgi:hypothetical protein
MYSNSQFVALEIMCRERATLTKKEMERWQAETEYWLAEAEEWRRFRESLDPLKEVECLEA